MSLPTFEQCEEAVKRGDATALQRFIHDNEPAGVKDVEWRLSLIEVINEIERPSKP